MADANTYSSTAPRQASGEPSRPVGESPSEWGEKAARERKAKEKKMKQKALEGSGIFGRYIVFEPDGDLDPREAYDPD